MCGKYGEIVRKINQLKNDRKDAANRINEDFDSVQKYTEAYFNDYAEIVVSKLLMTKSGRVIIDVFVKSLTATALYLSRLGWRESVVIAQIDTWFNDNITDAIQKLADLFSGVAVDGLAKLLSLMEILANEAENRAATFNERVSSLNKDIKEYLDQRESPQCVPPVAVNDVYIVDCNAPIPSVDPLKNDKNVPPGAIVEWIGQLYYPDPDQNKKCSTIVMLYQIRIPGNECGDAYISNTASVSIRRVCCDQSLPPNPCDDPAEYRRQLKECCEKECGGGACDGSIDCGSHDPNDITGPVGVGSEFFVTANQTLDYLIGFENDPEEASAPAAVVRVVNQLDDDLDFATFRLGVIQIGDLVISDAVGKTSYQTRIDLTARFGVFLDISAGIDVSTGEAVWELKAIDPETGDVPFSPLLGILPPNRDGSEGQGYLGYSVKPKAGLATGTRIDAQATIYFDQNEAIDTPAIFNTIDAGAPTSAVLALPSQSYPGLTVSWAGEDDAGGSGIDHYNIFVAVDGGPFTLWLEGTSLTSATFDGAEVGRSYAFFSQAVDLVGHVEAASPSAQAWTTIVEPVVVNVVNVEVTGDPADGIRVSFDGDLNIESLLNTGAIVSAATLHDLAGGQVALSASAYSYDSASRTLTISTGQPLGPGTYELRLDGSQFKDGDGVVLRGGASGLVFQTQTFQAAQAIEVNGSDLKVDAAAVPQLVDWNGDGLMDLAVGELVDGSTGKIRLYRNIGSNIAPVFAAAGFVQTLDGDLTVPAGGCLGVFPRFFDWSGDGRMDLVLGLSDGSVQFWINVNTSANPIYQFTTAALVGAPGAKTPIGVDARATVDVVDWNNDGRPDLVVGGIDGKIRVFLNHADGGLPDYREEMIVQAGGRDLVVPSGRASVVVVDLDGDGRKDLVVGNTEGQLLFHRNLGTDAAPVFGGASPILVDGAPVHLPNSPRTRPFVGDFNGDGVADLLIGTLDGAIRLHLGNANPPFTGTTTGAAGGAYLYTFQITSAMAAVDDDYETIGGTTLIVDAARGVMANDQTGGAIGVQVLLVGSGPAHGALTLNPNGSFSYIPNAGFQGLDQFSYVLSGGGETSNPAIVTILVTGRPRPTLTAVGDAYEAIGGTTLIVDAARGVMANDQTGGAIGVQVVLAGSGPAHGALTLNPNGSFSYIPNAGFQGLDQFSYVLSGGGETSNPATVTILVTGPPQTAPTVVLIASSPSSTYGRGLTFSVVVAAGARGLDVPSGSVQFFDGKTLIDTQTLDASGRATSRTISSLGAGEHAITARYLGDHFFDASTTDPLRLVVAKALLTVRALDATREYGDPNPAFASVVSGFVNGETAATAGIVGAPSLSTSALPNSPVAGGPYSIMVDVSRLSAANYDFAPVNGRLTVSKAPLSIRANNQTMPFKGVVPPLSHALSGFKNGETASVTTGSPALETVATAASPVGAYPITIALGDFAADNYYVASMDPGSLMVQWTTTVMVSATPRSAAPGSPVRLMARVASPRNRLAPSGLVQFQIDGVSIGDPIAVRRGVAVGWTAASLIPGDHAITAEFIDPSGRFQTSASSRPAIVRVIPQGAFNRPIGRGVSPLPPRALAGTRGAEIGAPNRLGPRQAILAKRDGAITTSTPRPRPLMDFWPASWRARLR